MGPIYRPTRYSFSTAFLSTDGFRDTDSLAARMIQARFTGWFRFGCKAFLEFMSDASRAAAGSNARSGSHQDNPKDFTSRFDRNILLHMTILFAESYRIETDGHYEVDPIQLWCVAPAAPVGVRLPTTDAWPCRLGRRETCEFPNGFRNAVPTSMWQLDPDVYGDSDLFGHEVEPIDIAPIRSYGSLSTLQGRAGTHYEDYTQELPVQQLPAGLSQSRHDDAFLRAREHRSAFSVSQFVRRRLCDPEQVLSIEEAIGNPPEFEVDIRDTSGIRLRDSDMLVPSGSRGESAFDSTKHAARQCPPQPSGAPEGCDINAKWSFQDSTMLSMVYVTSSHDPDILPGIHRLVDLKAFADINCNQLKNQRCGVRREVVFHGRPQPKCGFFCKAGQLGMGIATASASIGVAAVDLKTKKNFKLTQYGPNSLTPVDERFGAEFADVQSVRASRLFASLHPPASPGTRHTILIARARSTRRSAARHSMGFRRTSLEVGDWTRATRRRDARPVQGRGGGSWETTSKADK